MANRIVESCDPSYEDFRLCIFVIAFHCSQGFVNSLLFGIFSNILKVWKGYLFPKQEELVHDLDAPFLKNLEDINTPTFDYSYSYSTTNDLAQFLSDPEENESKPDIRSSSHQKV